MPSAIVSETRTLSKAYQFLASGKLVIAMRVGDLDELYPHSAVCLENEKPTELAALIRNIAQNPECSVRIADRGLLEAANAIPTWPLGRTLGRTLSMPTPEKSSHPMKLMSIITNKSTQAKRRMRHTTAQKRHTVGGHSYDVVTLDSPDTRME